MALKRIDRDFAEARRRMLDLTVFFTIGFVFFLLLAIAGPLSRDHTSGAYCFLALVLASILFALYMIGLVRLGQGMKRAMKHGWWSVNEQMKYFFPVLVGVLIFSIVMISTIAREGGRDPNMIFNILIVVFCLPIGALQYHNMRKFPALATGTTLVPRESSSIIETVIRRSGRKFTIGRKKVYHIGRMKRYIIDDGTEVRLSLTRASFQFRSFVMVGPYDRAHRRVVLVLAERLDEGLRA